MLLYDGLHFFGLRSICRLRVVLPADDSLRVVLATNLHDAPGASITNDFEALVESVSADFGERRTRWLLHHPSPDGVDQSWTEAMLTGEEPEWRRISRDEAETMTGLDLSPANAEPATIASLAGESQLLRSLAETPEPERLLAQCLRVVPVAAVPFPHGPFRCPHIARFRELARIYPDADRVVVGAHWHLTLTTKDFANCPFHDGEWRKVAEASLVALESARAEATYDELMDACIKQSLPPPEAKWLISLFRDPIVWTPGSREVTNGQHRACALRAAGARYCVVDTDGFQPPSLCAASPGAAASAVLASYWAAKSAEG
jgi:hypothetical protein